MKVINYENQGFSNFNLKEIVEILYYESKFFILKKIR